MSAILLTFHRDGSPVPREPFLRQMAALDARGPDGRNVAWLDGAALGHQRFATTPEEEGEVQPVASAGAWLAFHGRLDNRDELRLALGGLAAEVSDAALALAAFQRWGTEFPERLLGPFAVVVVEPSRRVLLARDALGDRTLFYRLTSQHLLVASEEGALLEHPDVSRRLNERTVARFLAVAAPAEGETFFDDVAELPPATAMTVEPDRHRTWRHWLPPAQPAARRSDAAWVEAFRETMAEAVLCRLRGAERATVFLSGGLDSTTVAAHAAPEMARRGDRLTAVSWVFDELDRADERAWIAPMVERYGLDWVQIDGDAAWPLRDAEERGPDPGSPRDGIYASLHEQGFAITRARGGRVVLTGEAADHLFSGGGDWLRDLLREGRLLDAGRQIGAHAAHWRAGAPVLPFRAVGARAIGWRGRPRGVPDWLTEEGRRLVAAHAGWNGFSGLRRPEQGASVLSPALASGLATATARAARAGVELRLPFRDRRLVELALTVPGHLLYRPGWRKWLLREAGRGLLPESVRTRRRASTMTGLYRRGMVEREQKRVEELLWSPNSLWRRYVRVDSLRYVYPAQIAAQRDRPASVLPWQCVCLERWLRRGEQSFEV